MTLIVDCETVPLAASLAVPYVEAQHEPPKNYAKPEAIAGWHERNKAAWQEQRVKESSLNPRLGRIVALGCAVTNHLLGETLAVTVAPTEDDEEMLLVDFWGNVKSFAPDIVTFNGSFDLRFILLRSLVHDVKPTIPVAPLFRRYTVTPHFDVRAVLTNWDARESGTLTEWCQMFGIETRDTGSGADVWAWYQAGQFDKIQAHCADDIRMTKALYERIAPAFQ